MTKEINPDKSQLIEKPYWRDAMTNLPCIPEGEDHIQLLYRSKPHGKRVGIINATRQMLDSIGKWQHVCAVFAVDNWAYVSSIL